jgi:hypothetical protein
MKRDTDNRLVGYSNGHFKWSEQVALEKILTDANSFWTQRDDRVKLELIRRANSFISKRSRPKHTKGIDLYSLTHSHQKKSVHIHQMRPFRGLALVNDVGVVILMKATTAMEKKVLFFRKHKRKAGKPKGIQLLQQQRRRQMKLGALRCVVFTANLTFCS